MEKQILTTSFEGQLANRVLILFKLLKFARDNNIPQECIIVNGSSYGSSGMNPRKYGKKSEKAFLLNRMGFLQKISSIIVSQEEWNERTKDLDIVSVAKDSDAIEVWNSGKSVCLTRSLLYPQTITERNWLKEWFLNESLVEQAKEELQAQGINPDDAVALHIRRMDFQDYHNGKFLLSNEQIAKLVKEVPESKQVVVFSDDIPWCKDNITRENGSLVFNDSGTDVQDLMRMTVCSSIIRNPGSSFSNLAFYLHP